MTKHLHFVVNPRAGRGKAVRTWESILEAIHSYRREIGDSLTVTQSWVSDNYPFEQLDKDTILVCIGGDGSVHHVGGVAVRHDLTLGVIPAGTGNDFASNTGLQTELGAAIRTVLQGDVQLVDVLRLNEEIAVNVAGFGLDATVVHVAEGNPWMKRLGSLAYGVVMPVAVAQYKPYSATLTLDGETSTYEAVSLCAIANGPRFGGGMRIAPQAVCDDGLFELCIVHGLNKIGVLRAFPSIYSGKHIHHPNVCMMRGRSLEIRFHDRPPQAEYDGEPVQVPSVVRVETLPRRLRILVPRKN